MPAGRGEAQLSSAVRAVTPGTGSGEVTQDVSFSASPRGHPLQLSLLTHDRAHALIFLQDVLLERMRHEDRRMALPLCPLVFSLWP